MSHLSERLDTLTNDILNGTRSLDDALASLETWLSDHKLSADERRAFSATLDMESSGDNRSLIDSVLKLHTARLIYRQDALAAAGDAASDPAQQMFGKALQESEQGINEVRIDVAIANAHNLLDDAAASRRWLDSGLERLAALASVDLVAIAQNAPLPVLPRLNILQRVGLKLTGFNLDRLAQRSRDDRTTLARMQANQVIILAHLIGVSFEAQRERQRARRAFRVAAHLIIRYGGMLRQEAIDLVEIAESIKPFESEAALILARQAQALYEAESEPDTGGLERVQAILKN